MLVSFEFEIVDNEIYLVLEGFWFLLMFLIFFLVFGFYVFLVVWIFKRSLGMWYKGNV